MYYKNILYFVLYVKSIYYITFSVMLIILIIVTLSIHMYLFVLIIVLVYFINEHLSLNVLICYNIEFRLKAVLKDTCNGAKKELENKLVS